MDPVTHKFNPLATQVDIEKVAVCSCLRSLKSKRTIESRAKRSSKIISLGHDSTLLASSYTMKMKMEILLEPTSNKLLVHSQKHLEKPLEVMPYTYNALPVPDLLIHHHQCHLSNQLAMHSTEFQLPPAYTLASFPCDKLHPLLFLASNISLLHA
nr:hypothetical protein [Tanacetum cinerariifolium]